MGSTDRAARTALVVLAGALGLVGVSSTTDAQERRPRVAHIVDVPRFSQPIVPYPGATVGIDPSTYFRQQFPFRQHFPFDQQFRFDEQDRFDQRRRDFRSPTVIFVPVPYGGGGGYGDGYGYATVTDVNGQPLYTYFHDQAPRQQQQYAPPIGTPDFSGTPYAVTDGGMMAVDFGNGDRRSFSSCVTQAAAATPDGKPRT
ncbi:MAG TPA: hypothetical protein VKC15_12685, partial [Gemmatimonadales bacterium]|nr:hypothetical protein [Gemmatimonadales bacterium]